MKVLVFVVNFRADRHLLRFVGTLRQAMARCSDARVSLHVFDNSERAADERAAFREAVCQGLDWVRVEFSPSNLGYFGALGRAQELASTGTECVIFCNPDVAVAPDFLETLLRLGARRKGVLAPSIVAEWGGFDQNPQYVERPSRGKLLRLRRIYSSELGFLLFSLLVSLRERLGLRRSKRVAGPATRIHTPHGALFVFTDVAFFRALPPYPCFLFGEELFVGEEARLRSVPVSYEPELRVTDSRHASIRLLSTHTQRKLKLEGVRFLLDRYYVEEEPRSARLPPS